MSTYIYFLVVVVIEKLFSLGGNDLMQKGLSFKPIKKTENPLASRISQVDFRFSFCLPVSSCKVDLPTFKILQVFETSWNGWRPNIHSFCEMVCILPSFSTSNACNSSSLNFFYFSSVLFAPHIKVTAFKVIEWLIALYATKSMIAASLYSIWCLFNANFSRWNKK